MYRKQQFKKNNLYEQKFYSILSSWGIEFNPQYAIPPYIADIAIPKKGIIIEIDGAVHNKKPTQIRDEYRDEYLSSFGFIIIRYKLSGNKEPIKDFLERQLLTFPDLKKRRYLTILKKVNRVKSYLTIPGFKIDKFKCYLQIRFKFLEFKHRQKREEKFKKYCKNRPYYQPEQVEFIKHDKFNL
jgi:very-short-patch-repair endonuclease